MLEKKFLLGVGITNAKEDEVLEYILQSLKKSSENYYIVTPNPEILVYANKHPEFKRILNNARLALCDGIGVFWAGKLLGKSIKQRVTGVDFLESLCKAVSKQPITVGFLGGGEKIAERTAECLVRKYPGLKVVFAASEWSKDLAARGPAPTFPPASAPPIKSG
ncbi:MAG: WecB/TagA/CpsF family glycosyltransferase, partial [bacterium]|nr:WecB/TagA/CpsF family glycosyltransferase [bacterium]